jgi:hypothetical protein
VKDDAGAEQVESGSPAHLALLVVGLHSGEPGLKVAVASQESEHPKFPERSKKPAGHKGYKKSSSSWTLCRIMCVIRHGQFEAEENAVPRAAEVRISKRVLWIGRKGYSLDNIGYASVKRKRAVGLKPILLETSKELEFLWVLWLIIWLPIWFNKWSSSQFIYSMSILVAGGTGVPFVAALVWYSIDTRYELIIQAAGESVSALTSTDRNALYELAQQIMDTIDNPDLEFRIQLNGDQIIQVGDHNIGKDVRD